MATPRTKALKKYISFLLLPAILVACGGGGGSKGKPNTSQATTSNSSTISSSNVNSSISSNSSSSLASVAPTATVLFPPQNAFTEGSTILVRGTASDSDGSITNVSVNGVKAASTDGFATWSVKLPTQVGTHVLDVTVTDNTGVTNQTPIQQKITHQAAQIRQASRMAFDRKNNRALVLDESYNNSLAPTIIAVDLNTGAQTIFSDNNKSEVKFQYPWGITVDDAGNRALVIDADGLIAIDLTTGDRTLLNLGTLPGSTEKLPMQFISFDNVNSKLWASSYDGIIFSVDLLSGTAIILEDSVSDNMHIQIPRPDAFQVDPINQRLIMAVTNELFWGIVGIDMHTGDQTIISDRNTPNASNMFRLPSGTNMAIDSENNRIFSTDYYFINEINGLTGERQPLVTSSKPSFIKRPLDIFFDAKKNRLVALDYEANSLIAFDLSTKNEYLISEIHTNAIANPSNEDQVIAYDPSTDKIFSANYESILTVDPNNGERSIFKKINSNYYDYDALTYDSSKNALYYNGSFESSINSINLSTKEMSVISSAGKPNFLNLPISYSAIELDKQKNQLIAADKITAAIYSVDLSTGERNIVSDNKRPNSNNPMSHPIGIDLDEVNNRLFVVDLYSKSVYEINMSNGERKLLTGPTTPNTQYALIYPQAIAYDSSKNRVLVVDTGLEALIQVDISTGERSIISSNLVPDSINPFQSPGAIQLNATKDTAYITDYSSKKFLSVNLLTGKRIELCSLPDRPKQFVIDSNNNRAIIASDYPGGLYIYDFLEKKLSEYKQKSEFDSIEFLENDRSKNRFITLDQDENFIGVNINDGSTNLLYDASADFSIPSKVALNSEEQKVFVLDYDEKLYSTDLNAGASSLLFSFRNNYSMTEDIAYVNYIAFSSSSKSLFLASRNSKNQNDLWRFNLSDKSLSIVFQDKTPVLTDWAEGSIYVALNDAKNLAYLVDDGRGSVTEVNLTDGSYKILSDKITPNVFNPILSINSITLDTKRNRLLISQYYVPGLLSIDLETGERVYVSR